MISVASRFPAPASTMPSSSAALPPLTMSAPCHQTTPSSFTLPRLRIPHDAEAMTLRPSALYHSTGLHREEHESRENFTTTVSPAKPMGFAATASPSEAVHPLFGANRSPLSPASFSQQPELKFGLAHLLEAAEHCHSIATSESTQSATRKRPLTTTQPPHSPSETHDPMAFTTQRLHSIDYLIHNPVENLRGAKRARPTLALDVPMYNEMPNVHPGYHVTQYEPSTPVYFDHTPEYPHMTPSGSRCESSSQSSSTRNVWETVLVTGDFPEDVCLSENPASTNKGSDQPSNPVKQGRWTNDEKEFAENLIQQVRNGEVMLPPNMSLRKFIAESLQCKAMRVSKKFRSLRSCQSPDGSSDGERSFNPLSLHSIMNEDATFDSFVDDDESSSPKRGSKTLKRSDYSQHGAVRSGRWSVEEENYAKAMIEAFKAGYLPLHGNVSLRKFLSEVLVCHPMRISKKFVGYVRKYHWYRIAAGKCDPEAKRRALEQLCVLEREFWASMQQNQEWTSIQQENRR